MKTLRYFFAIAASALMMFSCQKDAEIDNIINGGKLTFRLEIPEIEQVEVTRGAVEETEAYNVSLFIFDREGVRVTTEEFDLTPTNENSYTRIYEHESTKSLSAGTYDIYAIANTSSNALWNGISQFDGVHTKKEFEAIALTMTGVENTSTRMTLSGHTTYTVSGGNSTLAVNMQLSRPYAKVTFNVKNGTVNPNFTFTPTSYDIYNVPAQSRMFESSTNDAADYKDYTGRAIGQSGSFEYWQMENSFNVVPGLTKYTEREKRKSDSDRTFAFAPANSTYVVIYGEAIEKDANGNTVKNAKVNYTIHLGDFSPTGNVGNFSVERNTHYTYNVTVNGVDMIEVEAKRENGEYENGAEGTIIDMTASKQVYNLDAHYETVLLQLDVDALHAAGDAGIDAMTLSVSTPIMDAEYKNKTVKWSEIEKYITEDRLDEFYAMYDAKWVEFLPVSSAQFVAYPGVKEDGTPKGGQLDICSLMKAIANKNLPEAADGLNYVVAFVNEFYYDDWDWPVFVNKQEGREMKILQSPEISADKHSVYSQALCAFHQKSISTMFDIDSEGNVFGIEMYDETGKMDFTEPNNAKSLNNNGWVNVQSYTANKEWASIVGNGGYNYNGQPNGNTNNVLVNKNNAAYACMQRNRDNNGNNTIDDNEIRWYAPALNQMIGFWYGEASLPTYARLYQGDMSEVSNYEQHNQQSHIYTSTSGNGRIFWAIEGSSFSQDNTQYQAATHNSRCIRNLKAVELYEDPENPDQDLIVNINNRVVKINGFTEASYRLAQQNGQYPQHNERDVANKLPKAFKVAEKKLTADVTAISYSLEAPNISSVTYSNGAYTITFAEVIDGYGYYWTTSDSFATTNPINIVNNQVNITSNNSPIYIWVMIPEFTTTTNNGWWGTTTNYVYNRTTVTRDGAKDPGNPVTGTIGSSRSTDTFTLLESTTQPLCSNYYEESDQSDKGMWRVPNQRELTILHTYRKELGLPENNSNSYRLLSSTTYSNNVNASDIGGTYYWRYAYCNRDGNSMKVTLQSPTTTGLIRCVRDVEVNNGSMGDGGGAN